MKCVCGHEDDMHEEIDEKEDIYGECIICECDLFCEDIDDMKRA
jgi:hypothetical protein